MIIANRFARQTTVVAKRFLSTNSGMVSSKIQTVWHEYNRHLVDSPILTKSITAGIIALVADVVCQVYFPSKEDANKSTLERIRWRRAFNFTFLSGVIMPPIMHYWYGYLSTQIVGTNFLAAAKRVACDQLLFAPCIIPVYFIGILLLEGQFDKIIPKIKADWLNTVLVNYSVWVPAQLINFSVVPAPLRVLWANFVGFFWGIYLSNAANKAQVHAPVKVDDIKQD